MRRFLVFTLLVCSAPAFAQENPLEQIAEEPAGEGEQTPSAEVKQAPKPAVVVPNKEVIAFSLEGSEGTFRKQIDAAIEDTVDDMNFITRPIARGKLQKSNVVFKKVFVTFEGDDVEIRLDSRKSVRTKGDGKDSTKWKRDDGEEFKVTQKHDGDHVLQTYKSEDGKKVIDYQLSADHKTLTMAIEVISSKLPKSLKYTLRYKAN